MFSLTFTLEVIALVGAIIVTEKYFRAKRRKELIAYQEAIRAKTKVLKTNPPEKKPKLDNTSQQSKSGSSLPLDTWQPFEPIRSNVDNVPYTSWGSDDSSSNSVCTSSTDNGTSDYSSPSTSWSSDDSSSSSSSSSSSDFGGGDFGGGGAGSDY